MKSFKVICKADGNWEADYGMKTFVTKKFFGLIKTTSVGRDKRKVHGPSKEEICIVTEIKNIADFVGYDISGYPFGYYDSENFVRLDEFTESQKEIAEKAEVQLN